MRTGPDRLKRLLGRPELDRVVAAVRERVERGGAERISIAAPSEAERRAVDELLGRRATHGARLVVPLRMLEQVLIDAGIAADLPSALEAIGGPLRDRRGERERQAARWRALLAGHGARAQALGLGDWLDGLAADGLLKRLADGDAEAASRWLAQAMDVLERLPAGGIARSRLAAECLGDAHGLDAGRPVAALIRRALALRFVSECVDNDNEDVLWAEAGVLVGGGITSKVLVLNLAAKPFGPGGEIITAAKRSGEPIWLTLRQVLTSGIRWRADQGVVSVCENPSVVAEAASRLGSGCRPLVCTWGQPSSAVTQLLRQLRTAGIALRYHGDFDWPGLRIANGLIARFDAAPWRMGADDYAAAPAGKPLTGDPVEAAWDARLGAVMQERRQVVEEELVLQWLLEDLGTPSS